mgnify:CR=1 FL=1
MATFDLDTFLKVQGQTGTGAFQALGMAYGMPSCMLNLAQGAMSLLPSSVLSDMQSKMLEGKAKANEITKEVFKKLMLNTGIIEFDTETGLLKFGSDTSWMGIENDDSQTKNNLGGLLGAFQYAASFGAQIYQNYTDITNQIDAISDCLDKFNKLQSFQSGNSAEEKASLPPAEAEALFNTVYAGDKARLESASEFMSKCTTKISEINTILQARSLDPELEPKLLNSRELDPYLDKTNFRRVSPTDPEVGREQKEVFRLTYGPPISTAGQYVLTSDGLYYDSQSGGLDPVFLAISGIVPLGDKWNYNYDPNLGGRGQSVSIKSLNKFTDNMFDPDLIDDSRGLQVYYEEDHFLSVLKQQRNKHVYDLSADLVSFISEFGEGSSIVKNQRNLIISDIANHNSKINRRKKQIEVAVKAPQVYGRQTQPKFAPGNIPINDFSYLADYNLEVGFDKQNSLIFNQADVAGIVLPINAKFARTSSKPPSMTFDQLRVPTVGKGSILYSPSSTQAGTVLSLNDQIVYDDLFAIYNFLETKVELPSSLSFETTNCATEDRYNNAQMVAASTRSVFVSGLAIPYLEGIVENKSSDTAAASALGSFVKMPDSPEFQNLTYSSTGFTLECWAHVPDIMDGNIGWLSATTSSLTKVLLANENVGNASGATAVDHTGTERDLDYLKPTRGENFVRGLVCGFTRDRRLTQEIAGYSNINSQNDPVSSLSFFIAPTQSRDMSAASWVNNDECQDIPTFHKMKVDLSATNFGNVSSQFVLIDVTCDPINDEIKMFADGDLVATSSLASVFGTEVGIPISLPNFKKNNSFQYSSTTVDGPEILKQGPLLNPFYTPWIVGGGYTDGMYQYGNFLGGDRGGITSGLRGNVGSLKFYSRPLDNSEVLQNYKAQEGFFKNIQI